MAERRSIFYEGKCSYLCKVTLYIVSLLQLVQQDARSCEQHYLDVDDATMKFDFAESYKLYVANSLDTDPDRAFAGSKLNRLIDRYGLVVSLEVILPETDIGKRLCHVWVILFSFVDC